VTEPFRLPRLTRKRLLSRRTWRRRLVFWLGALIVGLVGVAFAGAANWCQHLFGVAVAHVGWLPIVVTPASFVVCAWLARTVFKGAQGSGIPQAIAARTLRTSRDRHRLLSLRLVFGKIALTLLGLLTGASVGREGPTVQVGAGVMLEVAGWGGLRHERGLILAGSAAGIAAAFNTPLAGIVFAIEEMSRSFEQRTNGLVLYAVIIAGLVSLGLVGNYSYFGSTSDTATTALDWALVVVCGVVGGLLGGLWSRLLLDGSRFLRRHAGTLRNGLLWAFACGLVVALIGLATDGATFGTGYTQARGAVEGGTLGFLFWPAKFAATLVTAWSGIPGGIFAPSLAVGAGLGSWIGQVAGAHALGFAAVIGMAGYFAGVVQAPITAFVIILEMTGNNANVIPLMLAAVLGFGTSKLVAPEPLYHGLAQGFIAEARKRERKGPAAASE
jgi:H+/Cl- antiporter ClcA